LRIKGTEMEKILKSGLILFLVIALTSCETDPVKINYLANARSTGIPLIITSLHPVYDFSNGIRVDLGFVNTSKKSFKMVKFNVFAFNIDGNKVNSNTIEKSGLIKPNEEYYVGGISGSGAVWYSRTIRCIELDSVVIEFTDGSKARFSGTELPKLFYSRIPGPCKAK